MNLQELLAEKDRINVKIAALMEPVNLALGELNVIEEQINSIITDPIKQARMMAGKDTGTVDVLVNGVMVKHTMAKVVKWHQDKLAAIRQLIAQHNDDPDRYMKTKVEYRIDEKAYHDFPEQIKAVFADAREIKAGPPKITFDTSWR